MVALTAFPTPAKSQQIATHGAARLSLALLVLSRP